MYPTKNVRASTRSFFRSAMQNWPDNEPKAWANGARALSYLDFIWCFAPGISWVLTALLVTTKSHFWNASAIRERIMSADCSSVEIGAERIERTGVFAQIYLSALDGFRWAVYTDVYVSRYWTKVAPSVLDATRSDISPGTGFFVTRGRNYETGHFSRAAAGCRNTKSASPFASAPFFPPPLSLSRFLSSSPPCQDNKIYELYTLYELSDCESVWSMLPARLSAIGVRAFLFPLQVHLCRM